MKVLNPNHQDRLLVERVKAYYKGVKAIKWHEGGSEISLESGIFELSEEGSVDVYVGDGVSRTIFDWKYAYKLGIGEGGDGFAPILIRE
jgi:hypothetical protein